MANFSVELYIYDISKGLAKNLAHIFLGGKQIDGIWHTGVVVYGKEFFFGSEGISSCPPCGTILGSPDKILNMGSTQLNLETFLEYLNQQSQNKFKGECYHLFDHNCNTFSDVVCLFLTGKNIPTYITGLPSEVMKTPLGAMLKPFFDQMSPKIAVKEGPTETINENNIVTYKLVENEKIFKTNYDYSVLLSAYSYCNLADSESKLIEEILEYLLINDDANNFWNIAPPHIDALCSMLEDSECQKLASMLLQMICVRSDVCSLVFKFQKSNFCNFLEDYKKYSDETMAELLLCMCNILNCRENFEFLTDVKINLFTNICQHALLSSNFKINQLSCKLLNNMLVTGKDQFDVFTLGVSFIELFNLKKENLNDIYMWRSFILALELNNQLNEVCRAMQVKVSSNSSDQEINNIIERINLILA